tara:strand:+ start:150 stop:593 length:444 start_codon:yes stop_codon:yes gene_type:complete
MLPAMNPVEKPRPFDVIVPCQDCDKPVWMCEEVGLAYLVVCALRSSGEFNAAMQQTGGMCSAALVTRVGDPYPWTKGDPRDDIPFVYVTALDGPLVAGLYPSADCFENGDGEPPEQATWADSWEDVDNQFIQDMAVSQAVTWIKENL